MRPLRCLFGRHVINGDLLYDGPSMLYAECVRCRNVYVWRNLFGGAWLNAEKSQDARRIIADLKASYDALKATGYPFRSHVSFGAGAEPWTTPDPSGTK